MFGFFLIAWLLLHCLAQKPIISNPGFEVDSISTGTYELLDNITGWSPDGITRTGYYMSTPFDSLSGIILVNNEDTTWNGSPESGSFYVNLQIFRGLFMKQLITIPPNGLFFYLTL